MIALDPRDRILAVWLAAIAGFTDATGYLASKGYFVSFMSGNSTRLGVAMTDHRAGIAAVGLIILCFVGGVAVSTWLRRRTGRKALLTIIALLLAVAGLVAAEGLHMTGVACMAAAMGAANVVLADDGEVRVGLTYMTGALVKLGETLGGGDVRQAGAVRWYALLWIALVFGCTLGATLFATFGTSAIWIASLATLIAAILA